MSRMRSSHGWDEISRERKRELISAIVNGTSTRGPMHVELDLTDRCNIACYFCNAQDVRTKEQLPIKRAAELIDELADSGVKSVRLAGGGEPLFHRDILAALDHLERRSIVIDNITTNGVALGTEIAESLVRGKAREVLFSLNAVDAADYHRMMQVRPALFDKVLENIRHLIALRGESSHPAVAVQFLLDRQNWHRLVEMYELGGSLGCDRIAINCVLEIPLNRIEKDLLLTEDDAEMVRSVVEEILRRDRDARLLQIDFALDGWNQMLATARANTNYETKDWFPTAASFREANGGCFFSWYTATILGNGDVYPCCLLVKPGYKPLGNVSQGSFADQWNGPEFSKMRAEMREVLLNGSTMLYRPGRFKRLDKACVVPHRCWLKNMYFRGDQEFYEEFEAALAETRRKEVRWLGTPVQIRRALESHAVASPRFLRAWEVLRRATLLMRIWMKRHFGWNISGAT
jgi:MoaA/NifB/PqqE/SkfB family radical SAM enzyme